MNFDPLNSTNSLVFTIWIKEKIYEQKTLNKREKRVKMSNNWL